MKKEKEEVTHKEVDPELFGKLRNEINTQRARFREQLNVTKEMLEMKKKETELLTIKQHKLEGAIEATDLLLKSVLPTNNP